MKITFGRLSFVIMCLLMLRGFHPTSVVAQQELEYDATKRLFTLRYVGNDGVQRELVIVGANHVEPYVAVAVTASDGEGVSYEYTLLNRTDPLSEQKLFLFEVDSPSLQALSRATSPDGWALDQQFDASNERFYWGFHTSEQFALAPGDSIGFEFRSLLFPRLMAGRFVGIAPDISTLEGSDDNPELGVLVSSTNGVLGGWYPLQVVAPGRSSDELSNPINGVGILNRDLGDVCRLSWITNAGVCNSLRTKLEQAGRALERGRNEAAVGQLQAFLNELEAQHGPEPGKHVNDNAYWLLKVNVEFILERMTAGEA